MTITLKQVTLENWFECTKLRVKPEQLKVFPAPVVNWIAESKFILDFDLRAIYFEEQVVGFLVYCTTPDPEGNYWIPALMIDEKHQGKGYGKAALQAIIHEMSHKRAIRIMIGHRPENLIASQLYESLGFEKISDDIIDGEIVRLLQTH